MYTYYFEDLETGENFFVECETIAEAIDTAKTYFQRPRFLGIVDTEWAEIMGFDTYQKGVKNVNSNNGDNIRGNCYRHRNLCTN